MFKGLHAYSSVPSLGRYLHRASPVIWGRRTAPIAPRHQLKNVLQGPRCYSGGEQLSSLPPSPSPSPSPEPTERLNSSQPDSSPPSHGSGLPDFTVNTTILLTHSQKDDPVLLDRHWLRDSCTCDKCVDPDSGQKNFCTLDVPLDLPVGSTRKTEDGGLEVSWENDFLTSGTHVSRYSPAKVASFFKPGHAFAPFTLPFLTLWDRAAMERDRPVIDYNDWMASEQGFLSGLYHLHTHGLLFLRNVPPSEESVITIANKIGHTQETFYGKSWDVRSKPHAENIAYTSSFLGLHQDMLYLRDPPRIQLLHCIENSCEGGESIFTDSYRAGFLMGIGPPALANILKHKWLKYHYKKQGNWYEFSRPILTTSYKVYWSPPFQDSNQRLEFTKNGIKMYRKWLEATAKMRQLLEDEQWVYEYKLQPGECVLFDNLRVLHGRRRFSAESGSRWLKGTYIGIDTYRSKLVTLAPQLVAIQKEGQMSTEEWVNYYQDKYKVWERSIGDVGKLSKSRFSYRNASEGGEV
ncbi:hypothetical protein GGS23DRAFT_318515 [Durotheca rogersii]|uniref:uncharacterized protein n=1 Tax=Durotheca rogersii TaxID=419775 RepID=UPI0022203679|nr:uncharacterized protein GGS23DRAFT_318515 [Durotheca rogersii]KAI5859457.1 hypothetical protein GGS23DRAFT_318515 [Durotheca rogersii]